MNNTKSAFVAIVGRPNVGKSSLLNRLLGTKIAIVSNKPQTTRTRIMGVLTRGETQLVFTDTPGMHRAHNKLGEFMVRSINESVGSVDMCMLVVEADADVRDTERELIERFAALDIPAVLVINKIDKISDKSALAAVIEKWAALYDFSAVVPASAVKGDGMEELCDELCSLAEEGPHFFADDTLTDQPERVIAAEIIREKLLRLLSEEVPHGIAVDIEHMRERDSDADPDDPEARSGELTDIIATIYCERSSHKGIIIGKNGAMLKKVGTYARQDMEAFFGCKVNLKLWVKVRDDWRNSDKALRNFGFVSEE